MRQIKLLRQASFTREIIGNKFLASMTFLGNPVRCFRHLRLILLVLCIAFLSGCSVFKGWFSDEPETQVSDKEISATSASDKKADTSDKGAKQQKEEKAPEVGTKTNDTGVAKSADTPSSQVEKQTETTAKPKTEPSVDSAKKPPPTTDKADSAKEDALAKEIPKETKQSLTSPASSKITTTPKPANENDFVITVADKDLKHPFYGKGYPRGFSVNNVPGNNIVMERGKTYTLEVVTDPLHDVYLSRKEIGWGSSAWTQGITGQFIYNGTITVEPDKQTPSSLFYACRNHPYMGGRIYVVNKGEKPNIQKRVAPSKALIAAVRKPKKITKSMVSQKLMFADMLIKSKTTERVKKSDNRIAKKLQRDSLASIKNAKKALSSGKIKKAYTFAVKGVDGLKQVKELVPSESQLGMLKDRNKELLQSIDNFEKSHKKSYARTVKKKGKSAGVEYDHAKVNKLKAEAAAAVKGTDYAKANKSLELAQRIVTVAIKQMMDSQTVVYDLNFETAEEEYDYELRRFKGYEILIPIAVKMKRPSEGTKKLMNTFVEKGRKMRMAAIAKAKSKDFPTAIAMLLDATKEIRRALRMVGISQ